LFTIALDTSLRNKNLVYYFCCCTKDLESPSSNHTQINVRCVKIKERKKGIKNDSKIHRHSLYSIECQKKQLPIQKKQNTQKKKKKFQTSA
jgi:hypothetical protein